MNGQVCILCLRPWTEGNSPCDGDIQNETCARLKGYKISHIWEYAPEPPFTDEQKKAVHILFHVGKHRNYPRVDKKVWCCYWCERPREDE